MATIDLDGYRFEYFDEGIGDPLVLVHGSASDFRTWDHQRARFAERFRVITYSRRYHWPNEPIPEGADYAMHQHVEDLKKVLRALDASPAHLVGHSYGAFLCLMLAIKAPHLARTLVLAEPPAITLFVSNTPRPMELLKLLATRPRTAAAIIKLGIMGLGPATAAVRRGDMDEAMRRFGMAALGREAFHRLSQDRIAQIKANLIGAEFLGSGFPPLEARTLRSVQIPTLLMTGQSSPRVFHRLMDRIEELLPNTERAEIPNASHISHEDNADAFSDALQSFITKHS